MRRTEVQHNTPEQVREYIAEAARIVVEAELHPDFQVAAFQKAVDLLAAKNITLEQVTPLGLPGMAIPRGGH